MALNGPRQLGKPDRPWSHRTEELGRHPVIPEPDEVIQVCTAQALRAGIFHDQEPSDPSTPDGREVPPRLDGD
jgi:hypothetical protein